MLFYCSVPWFWCGHGLMQQTSGKLRSQRICFLDVFFPFQTCIEKIMHWSALKLPSSFLTERQWWLSFHSEQLQSRVKKDEKKSGLPRRCHNDSMSKNVKMNYSLGKTECLSDAFSFNDFSSLDWHLARKKRDSMLWVRQKRFAVS